MKTAKLLLSTPYPSGSFPRSRGARTLEGALREGPERSRGSGTKRGKTAGKNKPRTEEFILSAQERVLSVPGKFLVPQEKCSFLEERDQLNCTRKTQRLQNYKSYNYKSYNYKSYNFQSYKSYNYKSYNSKIINLIIKLADKDKAHVTAI